MSRAAAEGGGQAALPAPTARERVRRALSLAWVPLVASLVSLCLSIGSIVIATRDPAVVLLLPEQVRLVQGSAGAMSYIYLQPTFVSTGENDRVEVIRDMTLYLRHEDGEEVALGWDEVGRLDFEAADDSLSYAYVADAGPLLVAPDTAENPLALFIGPDGWAFEAGRYKARLVAHRVVAPQQLEARFQMNLSQANLDRLAAAADELFLAIPIEPGS